MDPYSSVRQDVPITLSASVVIPAWNAAGTLAQCLITIEQSSFNRKHNASHDRCKQFGGGLSKRRFCTVTGKETGK
jgi:hypothetical protein